MHLQVLNHQGKIQRRQLAHTRVHHHAFTREKSAAILRLSCASLLLLVASLLSSGTYARSPDIMMDPTASFAAFNTVS
jgi:hypothetical protein